MSKSIWAAIFLASVVLGTGRASAEDPLCPGSFFVHGGTEGKGVIAARAGAACQVPLEVHGNGTLSSLAIVRGPSNGSASLRSAGFRYQPKAGFTGKDSMTLRFLGVDGRTGKAVRGTLHLDINVH